MAISSADLLWKRSVNTGPGNTAAQNNPQDSLGGFMSSTQIPPATLHSIFDLVTGDENAAGDVEYRCVFLHNNHANLTWFGAKLWIGEDTTGGVAYAIALDGGGVQPANKVTAQAERVAGEKTPPSGEAFSAPATKAGGLTIGDVPAGSCVPVWIRRTAQNSGPLDTDNLQLAYSGDTSQ